jgi:hypothetical protein
MLYSIEKKPKLQSHQIIFMRKEYYPRNELHNMTVNIEKLSKQMYTDS